MVNHTDNAIAGAENETKVEKTHSQASRGPRAKYFFCISKKPFIYECIEASTEDEAKEQFTTKHEVPPNIIDGGQAMKEAGGGSGYYLAKGTGMSDAQRTSVTVTAEQMTTTTTTHIKGEFRGWIVFGNGLKGFGDYKDDELAGICFSEPVDKANKQPKPKMKKNEAVRMEDINIISQFD